MGVHFHDYNCMGHALRIKEWLYVGQGRADYKNGKKILTKLYSLKSVSKKDMVLGKEYIAYRYGRGDFHFARRCAKGHWSHKRGWTKPTSISQKEVFSKEWRFDNHFLYNSKVYLFEVIR